MAIPFSRKKSYYQNTAKLLANDAYLNCIRKTFALSDKPIIFNPSNYFVFSSNDSFIDNHRCYYRHTVLDVYNFEQAKSAEQNFQELHLQRNKKNCTLVLGNEFFAGWKDVEQKLTKGFAGECARLLDSDLFVSNITDLDNTSAVFYLKNIMDYLSQQDYEKIDIVFQLLDPQQCIKSSWWNAQMILEKSDCTAIKFHPSYHCLTLEEIDLVLEHKPYEVIKDMHFFVMDQKENGYILLTPKEFFCMYEWSITDLMKQILKNYTQRFKINTVAWKDYYAICNTDNPIPTVQKNWLEFTTGEKNLPFASDYNFINSITQDQPEIILDESDPYATSDEKYCLNHIDVKRVFHNVVRVNERTKVLFDDPSSPKFYPFKDTWLSIDKNNQKSYAEFVLKCVGWLK